MTKITLENVAGAIDDAKRSYAVRSMAYPHDSWTRQAALCRSAQAVIEAAIAYLDLPPGTYVNELADRWDALNNAVQAHARNEQGTGP